MTGGTGIRIAAFLGPASVALLPATPALAQVSMASSVNAGELDVPVNKSQVLRADRAYSKVLIGNPDIADIVPISATSVYVLGKKTGTTSLTLYDRANRLIAVVDVVVGPDVLTLRRQLSELFPGTRIAARMSNESVVLEGMVSNAVDADRAVQIAETYAPGKVVNMLSLGSAQQVMLEVRFAEVNRSALSQIGVGWGSKNTGDTRYALGGGASVTPGPLLPGTSVGRPVFAVGAITDSFGIISQTFRAFGSAFNVQ